MKTTVIRCSEKHDKKSGGEVTCRRFLAKIDEQALTLICPKCGQKYLVSRRAIRGFDVVRLPREALIPESPKES
jgi:predicted RNA-binding Zn-ribbon protein involved in translation (DUF1610 family)